jgi:hypothetical protein
MTRSIAEMLVGRLGTARTPRSGDEAYRRLETGRKRFLHLYWYVWDPIMGPMSLRVSTYLPFTITAYLNGHHVVGERLRQAGVGLYQHAALPFLKTSQDVL